MATIKEIAKECNVSIATVSNILNNKGKVGEKTKRLVLEQVSRMNYVPDQAAKNLKQRDTKTIGIITEDLTVFNTPEIVDGAGSWLEEHGYVFLLANLRIYKKYGNDFSYHQEFKNLLNDEISMMRANRVSGLIYVSAHSRDLSSMLDGLFALPAVVAYGFTFDEQIPSVIFHDEEAAYTIVKELLKRKTETIGIIAGEKNSLHTSERLLGCQRAMYDAGLLYNPAFVYYGDWSRKQGREASRKLYGQGVRTFFSMNDSMAAGVYDFAAEHGLTVGRDLFVGGIGSEISDVLRPRLTTVELPLFEIGRRAGKMILDLAEKKMEKNGEICKVPGKLLNQTRGSSGNDVA